MTVAWQALAQVTLTGTVKDAKGEPVPGAGIVLGSSPLTGTVTGEDGTFSLTVPEGEKTLVVSSLGYKDRTVQITGPKLEITLEDDSTVLDEAVAVGYGAMRRSDLTGSVSSVKVDEDNAAHSNSIADLLQGHVAGVQVTNTSASPGAGVSVRIRGVSSFTSGASDPLYVVDGIIINGGSTAETVQAHAGLDTSTDETNGLIGINPQDIASIEILKDASATAIYGSLGANGVVLITTKTSNRERPVIRFHTGVDVSKRYHKIPMLSFDEFCQYALASGYDLSYMYSDPDNREGLTVKPIDWQDYMMRTAVSQRYYFSVSGAPRGMPYFFSLSYNDKNGIIRNSSMEQFTARLNLQNTLFGGRLKVGTKTSFAYSNNSLVAGPNANRASSAASMVRSMLIYRPYISLQALEEEDDIDYEATDQTVSSPSRWVKDYSADRKEYRVTPSLYADWTALQWLSFNSRIGADFRSFGQDQFKGRSISRDNGSTASSLHYSQLYWNWDNTLTAKKKFGKHSVTGTLGTATSSTLKVTNRVEGWQIWQDRDQVESINNAVSPYTSPYYNRYETSLQSFYARGIYNWSDRYTVTATWRLDGSSKFQGRNKWATFPSFAAAWRLSEEPWVRDNLQTVSMAKLRLGWGQVGNQSIAAYKTLETYSTVNIPDHSPDNGSSYQVGLYPNVLANRDLRWETTEQWNAGLDIGLWRGRLTITADLYRKKTKDLLQNINISKSSGFTTMAVNSGSVLNRGFEFSLEAVPWRSRDIEWTVGGNISFNRGEITSIGEFQNTGTLYITPDKPQTCNYFYGGYLRATSSSAGILNYFIEGQPLGVFYGFVYDGVAQYDGDGVPIGESGTIVAGDAKYRDINGNGYIDDDDRTIIGDPNPDFTFGLSTKLVWKRLTASIQLTGSVGADVYNLNSWNDYSTAFSYSRNIRKEAFYNAWSPENPGGTLPRLGYTSTDRYSDLFVEDGSYLRLSSVAVSYRIPFGKDSLVKSVDVGFTGANLWVLTGYKGWDPDVNSFGSDINRIGIDMGSYPSARTVSLDLKFIF